MTNNLAPLVVEKVISLSEARDESRAWREMLEQALHLLGERERELQQVRERYHALLDQRRHERSWT